MSVFPSSPRPATSPWGAIQQADQVAPGIWSVMTASHGGLILSDARQDAMPKALKLDNGTYEEDADWCLVYLAFESELAEQKGCTPDYLQLARDTARCWHPDRFTAHTGEEVPTNDSPILRTRAAYQAVVGEYCTTSAWGDWAEWVPQGKVGVIARKVLSVDHLGRPSYAEDEIFALVDKESYNAPAEAKALCNLPHEIIAAPESVRPKRVA